MPRPEYTECLYPAEPDTSEVVLGMIMRATHASGLQPTMLWIEGHRLLVAKLGSGTCETCTLCTISLAPESHLCYFLNLISYGNFNNF